jgi:hypothetical protein
VLLTRTLAQTGGVSGEHVTSDIRFACDVRNLVVEVAGSGPAANDPNSCLSARPTAPPVFCRPFRLSGSSGTNVPTSLFRYYVAKPAVLTLVRPAVNTFCKHLAVDHSPAGAGIMPEMALTLPSGVGMKAIIRRPFENSRIYSSPPIMSGPRNLSEFSIPKGAS